MSLDVDTLKKRRNRMVAVNGVAALVAIAGIVGFLKFDLVWAGAVFVAALLIGFGAQIWFIAGLRGPAVSDVTSVRETRTNRGA